MTGQVETRVRYAETDQMGRAHHSHYIVWCEMGRTALMREHGASYGELERRGVMLPVTRIEIEYRGPLSYDEAVRVDTRISSIRSRSVTFEYEVYRSADEVLVARATTMLVCMDENGKTRRIPDDVMQALRAAAA
jgi:acyl-CoA thioester hydrolase